MKRIVAVFDGLDFAGSTMDFAIGYCKKSDAHLVGVFPESFLYHEYDFAELLGKNGISAVKIRHAVMKEAEKRARSRKLFADGCKKANISYSISHPEGITIRFSPSFTASFSAASVAFLSLLLNSVSIRIIFADTFFLLFMIFMFYTINMAEKNDGNADWYHAAG